MTGRDLILYILKNKLEDEPIFKDDKFVGFASELEMAAEMNVGVETVRALYERGLLDGIRIGDTVYISRF